VKTIRSLGYLPMLRPSPTLARKDFGSNDPCSIVTARRAQSSAGPPGWRFWLRSHSIMGLKAGKVGAHFAVTSKNKKPVPLRWLTPCRSASAASAGHSNSVARRSCCRGPRTWRRQRARLRPSPVRARISSRSNSARPPSTVSIRRPRGELVSAQASASDLKPAPAWRLHRGCSFAASFGCWCSLSPASGPSRPRWPAPLVEPGAVFVHLLALRCRRVALAG
jgi:hypothetical protein